jgi:hypothetical protein
MSFHSGCKGTDSSGGNYLQYGYAYYQYSRLRKKTLRAAWSCASSFTENGLESRPNREETIFLSPERFPDMQETKNQVAGMLSHVVGKQESGRRDEMIIRHCEERSNPVYPHGLLHCVRNDGASYGVRR